MIPSPTTGLHCEQCVNTYYGNPINGGKCTRKSFIPNLLTLEFEGYFVNFFILLPSYSYPLPPLFLYFRLLFPISSSPSPLPHHLFPLSSSRSSLPPLLFSLPLLPPLLFSLPPLPPLISPPPPVPSPFHLPPLPPLPPLLFPLSSPPLPPPFPHSL